MRASQPTPVSQIQARPSLLDAPVHPVGVQLRARRSARLVIIGILFACLGSLTMAWAWTATQDSQTVVLMAKDVARGARVEASDLATTTLGRADGVAVLPADQASQIVGQYAWVDLPAGSLPGAGSVGAQVVPAGTAHVGLRLGAGRLPSQPLPAGARVTLVAVPSAMDNDRNPGAQFEAIVVAAPRATSDGASWLLDVQVNDGSAAAVAALAAAERVSVVRKADG